MYKCLNGLVEHDMNFIRQQEQHDYNTRTKLNLKLPSVKRNWGKQQSKTQSDDCIFSLPSIILTDLLGNKTLNV